MTLFLSFFVVGQFYQTLKKNVFALSLKNKQARIDHIPSRGYLDYCFVTGGAAAECLMFLLNVPQFICILRCGFLLAILRLLRVTYNQVSAFKHKETNQLTWNQILTQNLIFYRWCVGGDGVGYKVLFRVQKRQGNKKARIETDNITSTNLRRSQRPCEVEKNE